MREPSAALRRISNQEALNKSHILNQHLHRQIMQLHWIAAMKSAETWLVNRAVIREVEFILVFFLIPWKRNKYMLALNGFIKVVFFV